MKVLRRPIVWFNTAMWLLSLIISALLIQLGSLVMSDIPTAEKLISKSDFVNSTRLDSVTAEIADSQKVLDRISDEIEDAHFRLKSIKLDYNTQLSNFENWVKTRSTTQSSSENPDVIRRAETVELIKNSERNAESELQALEKAHEVEKKVLFDLQAEQRRIWNDADAPYQEAKKAEALKVFMFRLALTIPLLLTSVWLILKKRKAKYWPVYRGFILFSLFAFFVELVPYLPPYGGYIRYAAGILLSLVCAHFLVKWRQRYLTAKAAESDQSEQQKRSNMKYEIAIKKISGGVCPSCDRSFAKKKSRFGKDKPQTNVDYCVHCGFSLFNNCGTCGTRENSFYKFCGSCGTASSDQKVAATY